MLLLSYKESAKLLKSAKKGIIKRCSFVLMANGDVERWLSGRKRPPRKRLSRVNGIEGSNPSLSSSHFLQK